MAVEVSLYQIIVYPFCFFAIIIIIIILLNLYFETLIFSNVINSTFVYFKFKNAELSKTTPYLVISSESCDTLSKTNPRTSRILSRLRRRPVPYLSIRQLLIWHCAWHRGLTCKLLRLLPDKHMVKMIMELV